MRNKKSNNIKTYVTAYYDSSKDTFFIRILPKEVIYSLDKQMISDMVAMNTMRLIKFMGFPQCEYWNYTEVTTETVDQLQSLLPDVITQLIAEKDKTQHTVRYYEDNENIYISFKEKFIFIPVNIYGKKIQEKYGKRLNVVREISKTDSVELTTTIDEIKNGKIIGKARKVIATLTN